MNRGFFGARERWTVVRAAKRGGWKNIETYIVNQAKISAVTLATHERRRAAGLWAAANLPQRRAYEAAANGPRERARIPRERRQRARDFPYFYAVCPVTSFRSRFQRERERE